MRHTTHLVLTVVAVAGCALKGDVRRVENQVTEFREQAARADSARAVMLARLLDELDSLNRAILDSLASYRRTVLALQGEVRSDLTDVQRQLVMIQELSGQSQANLNELRRRLEGRGGVAGRLGGSQAEDSAEVGSGPGPRELLALGVSQLRQGSPQTARVAFRKLLDDFPEHDRAADAQYFIGESFGLAEPDSAEAAYELVVEHYPNSPRAPAALYRLGLLFEQRGDRRAARLQYSRITAGYPQSEEAELARAKLRNP